MLAALGSQIKAVLSRYLIEGVEYGFSHLLAGIAANGMGRDLAGGAAHHQDLALLHFCSCDQLFSHGSGLFLDQIQIHIHRFCNISCTHKNTSVSFSLSFYSKW